MGEEMAAAVVATILSSIVGIVALVIQQRAARAQQSIQFQQEVTSKYDAMVKYRMQYPWVLSMGSQWDEDSFRRLYNPNDPDDEKLAIYYGYIELFTFYATAVLFAQQRGFLDPELYNKQHEPLIRLVLAEHYPIFSEIIRPDGFVSGYLVAHVEALNDKWDWAARHRQLLSLPG